MPFYNRFLRLTNSQWENSVHDLLELSQPTGESEQFLHAVAGTTDFEGERARLHARPRGYRAPATQSSLV